MNALGAYYSYLGKIETKQREKEEHFILATQYYNKASRIDMHEPSTWVGKGKHITEYAFESISMPKVKACLVYLGLGCDDYFVASNKIFLIVYLCIWVF